MTNIKLLKIKISEKGLKHNFLAKKLGLSRQSFSLKLNNHNEWKASEIIFLTKI